MSHLDNDPIPTLGVKLGEPLRIDGEEILPASCLVCHKVAWHLPSGHVSDGRAMLLDSEIEADQLYLFLHGCHFEPGENDYYDDEMEFLP